MATIIKQKGEPVSRDATPAATILTWGQRATKLAGNGVVGIRHFFWQPAVILNPGQRLSVNQQLLKSFSRRAVYWIIVLLIASLLMCYFGQWHWSYKTTHPPFSCTEWMSVLWGVCAPVSVWLFVATNSDKGAKDIRTIRKFQWAWFALVTATSFCWAAANFALDPQHSPSGVFFLGRVTFLWLTLTGQVITLLLLSDSIRAMLSVLFIGVGVPFWIGTGTSLIDSHRFFLVEWYALQLLGYCLVAWLLFKDHARTYAKGILLEESRQQAESAVEAKNQFIASISHDLRQPLTTLALQLNSLERKFQSSGSVDSICAAQRQVAAMETMINGALDVARLESGTWKVDVREVALPGLLNSIIQDLQPSASEKNIKLRLHSRPFLVKTDWHALDRIIRNMVVNAIRYTPSDREGRTGHILVGCQDRNGLLKISVWDNGIGIPENKREEIFKQYVQLGNPERDREKGFGLGLSIVRGLANLLSHQLEVESKPGHGSRFSVTVPIVGRIPPELLGGHPEETGDPDLTGMTVVVIDDDNDLRYEISKRFIECGCYVIAGESSADVIEQLRGEDLENGPHFILSDYRMRNENGIEAISAIRGVIGSSIPAMLWSGDTSSEVLTKVAASGIKLLSKPVADSTLLALIAEHWHKTDQDHRAYG